MNPRRSHLSTTITFAALVAVAVTAACETPGPDPSRVKLNLGFPDRDTAIATKSLVLLTRIAPADGAACSRDLFDASGATAEAFGTIIAYPRDSDLFAFPADKDDVELYVYAYGRELDRFCAADAECAGSSSGASCGDLGIARSACMSDDDGIAPLAGGCTRTGVENGGAVEVTVTLIPPVSP